jgi:hypothetical protein
LTVVETLTAGLSVPPLMMPTLVGVATGSVVGASFGGAGAGGGRTGAGLTDSAELVTLTPPVGSPAGAGARITDELVLPAGTATGAGLATRVKIVLRPPDVEGTELSGCARGLEAEIVFFCASVTGGETFGTACTVDTAGSAGSRLAGRLRLGSSADARAAGLSK